MGFGLQYFSGMEKMLTLSVLSANIIIGDGLSLCFSGTLQLLIVFDFLDQITLLVSYLSLRLLTSCSK